MIVLEDGTKFLGEEEFLNITQEFFEVGLDGLLRAEALQTIWVTLAQSKDKKHYFVLSEKLKQTGFCWQKKELYRNEFDSFEEAYEDFKFEYLQCKNFFGCNTELEPVAVGF